MSHMNKFLEGLVDHIGNLKNLLTDFRNYSTIGDRCSMWRFKTGCHLDLIESKISPIISIEAIEEDYLKDKASFLVHQIKENLGVELGYK